MDIGKETTTLALENRLWGSGNADVDVTVSLSHRGPVLEIVFNVREAELRRMVWEDEGAVWTDSCVEVFIKAPSSPEYSNFEFSASGAMLARHGSGRAKRTAYSEEERAHVKRTVRIEENNNKQSRWSLSVSIDLEALGLLEDGTFAFNAYKCGDGLKEPHYLSLFNIESAKPDFHRPDCFRLSKLV